MEPTSQHRHPLSKRDFALLALDDVAYVKPEPHEGRAGYAIHAADGTPIGWSEEREIAFAAVVQHEMEPVSVH